jgi:hypothetical protein
VAVVMGGDDHPDDEIRDGINKNSNGEFDQPGSRLRGF